MCYIQIKLNVTQDTLSCSRHTTLIDILSPEAPSQEMDYQRNEGTSASTPSFVPPNSIESFADKQPRGDTLLGNANQNSIVEEQNHQTHSTNPSTISYLLKNIRCFSPEIGSAVLSLIRENDELRKKHFHLQEKNLRLEQKLDPDRTTQTQNQVFSSSNTLCPHCKSFHGRPSSIMGDPEDILTEEIGNIVYQCPVEVINESSKRIRKTRLEDTNSHVTKWKILEKYRSEVVNTMLKSSDDTRKEIRNIKKLAFKRMYEMTRQEKEKEDQDTDPSPTKLLSAEEEKKAKEEEKKYMNSKTKAMETQLSKERKSNLLQLSITVISTMERNEHILQGEIEFRDKKIQMLKDCQKERDEMRQIIMNTQQKPVQVNSGPVIKDESFMEQEIPCRSIKKKIDPNETTPMNIDHHDSVSMSPECPNESSHLEDSIMNEIRSFQNQDDLDSFELDPNVENFMNRLVEK